MRILRYK